MPHLRSILDPSFVYTASIDTNIATTFARIRNEHHLDSAREVPIRATGAAAVVPPAAGRTASGPEILATGACGACLRPYAPHHRRDQ